MKEARMIRSAAVVYAVAGCLLITHTVRGQTFSPTEDNRFLLVLTDAIVCEGGDQAFTQEVNFAPLDESFAAANVCENGSGLARAAQTSQVNADGVTGSGSAASSALLADATVLAYAESGLSVGFEVTEPKFVRLAARLSAEGVLVGAGGDMSAGFIASAGLTGPQAQVILSEFLLAPPSGHPRLLNRVLSAPVSPGQYLIFARGLSAIDNTGTGSTGGHAEFDVFLKLTDFPLGDFDRDGLVDADDRDALPDCVNGPRASGTVVSQSCLDAFDHDGDGDVDLRDSAAFAQVFTQSGTVE